MSRPRRYLSEFLASALLLVTVLGSGLMAERLAGGNDAITLLANTLATIGGLYVLIEVYGPVRGAHLKPVVSAVLAARGQLRVRTHVQRQLRWHRQRTRPAS